MKGRRRNRETMREYLFATADLSQQVGYPLSCTYHILIRDFSPPISCESYGIRVTLDQTGEMEAIPDLTVLPSHITELAKQLAKGGVTPCTLRSVVEDWLP